VGNKKNVCANLTIKNCIKCPFHEVLPDPDPHDWFCDDDVKVVCRKTGKNITVACRPYAIRREADIPSWCPLKKEHAREQPK